MSPSYDPACLAAWPECETGKYDPRCCRFPKSCSASTLWPPPERGTHESDLYREGKIDWFHNDWVARFDGATDEENAEFSRARRWSLEAQYP